MNKATTQLDANLHQYIYERVFLLKQEPDDQHWLPEYPSSVRVLVESIPRE